MKNISLKSWLLLIIPVVIGFVACNDNDGDPQPACVAGKGGMVKFQLKPEHHTKPIPSTAAYPDSAWIKYNTSNFPGDNPALYDLIAVGTDGSFQVDVDSMKCGQYFIYMTGFDTSIVERVRGGIPVNITEQSGTKIIKVPVTED